MRRPLTYLIVLVIGVSLLLAGCGDSATDEPLPDARALLEEATQQLQTAESFELEITLTGYPVAIEVGNFPLPMDLPLTFDYARGVFVAPDRISADVQVSLGDLAASVNLVAIGEQQYMRSDTLTQGMWLQEEIIPGFRPSALVAEEGGIPSSLESITNLEMVGRADLDGLDVYHLRGQIEASNVYSLTFGLIGTTEGLLDVDVYILTDGHVVEQVVLHEPAPQPPPGTAMPEGTPEADGEDLEPTVWTVALQGYNEEYTIEAPQSAVATEAAAPEGDGTAPAGEDSADATSEPNDA